MGYQAPLDGLRALSLIAVVLYHGGFGGVQGGFLGVEVFFVVSGYLITVLLIEERRTTGTVSVRGFWARRARRLLPALVTMLVAVGAWVTLTGDAAQQWQVRRDLPWALAYSANWGQIVGGAPYFEPVDPPLLRHLWSLGVEEQWYVVWPLAFLALTRLVRMRRARASVLLAAAVAIAGVTWWIQRGGPEPIGASGLLGWLDGADRTNVNYLSTVTRSFGLLLGAALAFVWQPWWRTGRLAGATLDRIAPAALVLLGAAFVMARLTDSVMYPWGLAGVSLLACLLIAATVHPDATRTRLALGSPAMAAIGRRSYGLYLWHWPILVLFDATNGAWDRYVVAIAVSIVLAEICYRVIETPIRERRWTWQAVTVRPALQAALAGAAAATALIAVYGGAEPYDPARGGDGVAFEPDAVAPRAVSTTLAASAPSAATIAPATTAPPATAPATTQPLEPAALPVDVAIVGDSQAHSLSVNQPSGIGSTFDIHNGSVSGCSVFDAGAVVSERQGFTNSFEQCDGWQEEWSDAADGADVALVVIGAWDVFDIEANGATVSFGSPEFDRLFAANLRTGIAAMAEPGMRIGLLEVPCMRPEDVSGAGVPALPERRDDARVAHLNDLLRSVAAADPAQVEFVTGPTAWCADEAIASNLDYRWDGVHVYREGAGLVFDTIAPSLLQLAAEAAVEQ